jgi:hypothetical protein
MQPITNGYGQGGEKAGRREMGQAVIESDGIDVFVVYNGVRIAKREAQTWVSLEPGYTVWDKNYPEELVVKYEGKVVNH